LTHEAALKLAQEFFIFPEQAPAKAFTPATYQGGDTRTERDLEQLHLVLGLPAISMHDANYYALNMYANILGGGMSSRLFQEVREKRGLAYTVYAMGSAYEDCGLMSIYAATAPDKARELSGVLCEQVVGMAKGISDVEINRAKSQQKAELLMARENPQTVAGWIGRHLLLLGEYRPAAEIARRVDAVSKEHVLQLAETIAGGKLTVAALGDISGVLPYETLQTKLAA
jgi:predicted Zn-dependent peptidase